MQIRNKTVGIEDVSEKEGQAIRDLEPILEEKKRYKEKNGPSGIPLSKKKN